MALRFFIFAFGCLICPASFTEKPFFPQLPCSDLRRKTLLLYYNNYIYKYKLYI